MKPKDTSWGAIADWYDGLVEDTSDSYQKNVLMPNLIRVVTPKPGMAILDVACGQGYFARAFAQNGAHVIATDISAELVSLAKKHGTGKIEYQVAESHAMPFIKDGSIDVVTIVLALQNIQKMAETILECVRTIKSGGRMVIVLNHPAFRIPKNSSWRWDESQQPQDLKSGGSVMFRRLDAYMSEANIKMDMTPGEVSASKKKFTISFHRPLQSYFKSFNKAGLSVTRFEEWISHKKSSAGPRGAEEDRMRKEIPMFLMIDAKKI